MVYDGYIYVIVSFFERCRRRRNERNLAMCRKLDEVPRPYGISIDVARALAEHE